MKFFSFCLFAFNTGTAPVEDMTIYCVAVVLIAQVVKFCMLKTAPFTNVIPRQIYCFLTTVIITLLHFNIVQVYIGPITLSPSNLAGCTYNSRQRGLAGGREVVEIWCIHIQQCECVQYTHEINWICIERLCPLDKSLFCAVL